MDWLDPGDMERWMDPHGPGKPKMYRLWVDDASDGKGPNKLAVLHLYGQVTGRKPDPQANLVGRSKSAAAA